MAASQPPASQSQDVGADGDKGATKPVGETDSDRAPKEASRADATRPKGRDGEPLDDAELKQVAELKHRDREVRSHEMAHVSAGGQYVNGGPTYSFQTGPDGQRYAVGGEVSISTGKEATPQKSIAKARVIRQAALAPADPSAQDRAVAAAAAKLEQTARVELREMKAAETKKAAEERESSEVEAAEEAPLLGEGEGVAAEEAQGAQGLAPRPSHIPAAYTRPGGAAASRSAGGGPDSAGGGLLDRIA